MTTKAERDKSPFLFVKNVNKDSVSRVVVPSDLQVGTLNDPAELQLLGRLALHPRRITLTTNSTTGSITNDDSIVEIDNQTSQNPLIWLPEGARNGQVIFIKDYAGNAFNYPISITTEGGTTTVGQAQLVSIDENYNSLALFWNRDRWQVLIAGGGSSGGGSTLLSASFVTIGSEAVLGAERRLSVSSGQLTLTDNGPNSTVVLGLSAAGAGGSYTNANITVDSYGRVTAASNGTLPLIPGASGTYHLPSLTVDEYGRVSIIEDGGGNRATWIGVADAMRTTGTISVDPLGNFAGSYGANAFFYVGGTRGIDNGTAQFAVFGGDAVFSGSIRYGTTRIIQTASWVPLVTASQEFSEVRYVGSSGTLASFVDSFSGTLFSISDASGFPYFEVLSDQNTHVRSDAYFWYGLSGSITRLPNGTSYLVAGTNVQIASSSTGQVTISVPTVSGADVGAAYIIVGANTASLPNERYLNAPAGSGITITDNGANSSIDLGINDNVVATVSGATFTGPVSGTFTGSLTEIATGVPFFTTSNGIVADVIGDQWHLYISGAIGGGTGTGDGDKNATYIVVQHTGSLPNARAIAAGGGISISDQGPSGSIVITNALSTGSRRQPQDADDIIVWRINERSGTLLANFGSSGSLADLTGSSVNFCKAGVFDYAVEFSGSTSFATGSGVVQPHEGTDGFTVSGWIWPYTLAEGIIVQKNAVDGTPEPDPPLAMGLSGTFASLYVQVRTTTSTENILHLSTDRSLRLNAWNLVGFTVTGSSVNVYQNGDLVGSKPLTGSVDFVSGGWWAVGGLPDGSSGIDAKLNDIRVSNVTRDCEWWKNVYVNGLRGILASGTVNFGGEPEWRFDNLTGTLSASSFNLTGTPINGNVLMSVQGITQHKDVDYSLSGSIVTYFGVPAIQDGQHIQFTYLTQAGQITSGSTVADSHWTLTGSTIYTTASVAIGPTTENPADVQLLVSGNMHVSGTLTVGTGTMHISDNVISASAGDLTFFDVSNPLGKTLTQLVAGTASSGSVTPKLFYGFCSGNLTWPATTWTGFVTALTNFIDEYQVGITRAGSNFTFEEAGYYKITTNFNILGNSSYVGIRLSGSNGQIVQKTGWNSTLTDGGNKNLESIFYVSANETLALEYCRKNGSAAAWAGADPIDGENMRTGEVSIIKIGGSGTSLDAITQVGDTTVISGNLYVSGVLPNEKTPWDLSETYAFYDHTSMIVSGGNVIEWQNLFSGTTGIGSFVNDGANPPTYYAANPLLDSLPSAEFNGTNNFMSGSNDFVLNTFAAVFVVANTLGGAGMFYEHGPGDYTSSDGSDISQISNYATNIRRTNRSSKDAHTHTGGAWTWHRKNGVYAHYWPGGSSYYNTVFVNNQDLLFNHGLSGDPISTYVTASMYLGSRSGASYFFSGSMSAVLFLSPAPNHSDLFAVCRWLGRRYGIGTL